MTPSNSHPLCLDHTGHAARIANLEKGLSEVWKEINSIKNWVVVGMASLILEVAVYVMNHIPIIKGH